MTLPPPPCSGVVYNDGKTWLPLTDLNIYISIVDVSSKVVCTQTYFYEGRYTLEDAYYMFPIPPDAAVCGFSMTTHDGISVEGMVKEVGQARQDYEDAVQNNRLASLLEQYTHDIFVLSLGSFRPQTEIQISISFVMDLSNNDADDSIRFALPTYVGHRYGVPSASKLSTLKGTSHTAGLSIILDVQMSGQILDVHSNYVLEDVPTPINAGFGHHCLRKRYKSDGLDLHEAFMVIIQALGLDGPRCFAETCKESGTVALSLSVVPRFDSAQISVPSEYIFLIDRSGSMSAEMSQAIEALNILLHDLPATDTWFSVHAFDHSCKSLWGASRPFNEISLREALNFSNNLRAGGGTDLLPALSMVLNKRIRTLPTNIFVLTDGGVSDPDACIGAVRTAVNFANVDSPIRVFTLAFGHGASMALCEGLAAAGNGFCSWELDSRPGQLMRTCVAAMGAMMSKQLQNVKVDWGVDHLQQTPSDINMVSGRRLAISALVHGDRMPTSVSVSATSPNGSLLSYHVPVQMIRNIHFPLADSRLKKLHHRPLLHVLTAHKLILDLERNITPHNIIPNWHGLGPSSQKDAIQEEILNLGLNYQLTSSRTAFVAVDTPEFKNNGNQHTPPLPKSDQNTSGTTTGSTSSTNTKSDSISQASSSPPQAKQDSSPSSAGDSDGTASFPSSSSSNLPDPQRSMPGSFPSPPCIIQTLPTSALQDEVLYFLGKNVPPGIFVAPPLNVQWIFAKPVKKISSFISRLKLPILGNQVNKLTGGVAGDLWNRLLNTAQDLSGEFTARFTNLAQLQSYDGSFSKLGELCDLIGCSAEIPSEVGFPDSVDRENVWATALAMAFLRSKFPRNWLTWKDFAKKSLIWGEKACGDLEKFQVMIEQARSKFN